VRISPLNLFVDLVDEDRGFSLYQLTATANVEIDNRLYHIGHIKTVVSLSDITIKYFNWHREMYETFLEPWNFQVKIMRQPPMPRKILVQSSRNLQFNLTKSFLEMTSRVLSEKKWTAQSSIADKRYSLVLLPGRLQYH